MPMADASNFFLSSKIDEGQAHHSASVGSILTCIQR